MELDLVSSHGNTSLEYQERYFSDTVDLTKQEIIAGEKVDQIIRGLKKSSEELTSNSLRGYVKGICGQNIVEINTSSGKFETAYREVLLQLDLPDGTDKEVFFDRIYKEGKSFEIFRLLIEQIKASEIDLDKEKISINAHPLDILHPEFEWEMLSLFGKQKCKYKNLQIEILEAEITDPEIVYEIRDKLEELKATYPGLNFAIDDSDLTPSMKKRYDDFKDGVEVVKIDKDFFRYAVENGHIAELQGMYKILKLDGKKIVTEGVETDKHMKIAQELGSDYLQGYHELLGKPEEIPKDPLGIAA